MRQHNVGIEVSTVKALVHEKKNCSEYSGFVCSVLCYRGIILHAIHQ